MFTNHRRYRSARQTVYSIFKRQETNTVSVLLDNGRVRRMQSFRRSRDHMPGEVASEAVHPSLSDAHCGGAAEELNMEKVTPTGRKESTSVGYQDGAYFSADGLRCGLSKEAVQLATCYSFNCAAITRRDRTCTKLRASRRSLQRGLRHVRLAIRSAV